VSLLHFWSWFKLYIILGVKS